MASVVGKNQPNKLRVEGPEDMYAIRDLLGRHGLYYEVTPLPPELPEIGPKERVEKLLRGMTEEILASVGRAVGFVLDADSPIRSRWQAVRSQLRKAGVETQDEPLSGGFVGGSSESLATVGVWLMPDNQQDGTLETLLNSLVLENDCLYAHARISTDEARRKGARFSDPDHLKAVIHAWLAWQEKPGLPYGHAIRARYFRHDSPAANAFVAWFKTLYGIPDSVQTGPDPSS